jgi:UDP-N-acetylglucosamine transferase subunit ALG13
MGDLPLIFATVGTDVHPFHRMTHWIDGWLEQGGLTRAQCFMQTGTSEEPKLALHYPYLGYTEMEQKVREAAAVVCHGGPGTIMLCLALGKQPIVVPRAAARGEHVDDHQRAFSKRVAADGVILLAETEDQFRKHVELVLDGGANGATAHVNGHDPSATAARFEELVNGLFTGSTRPAPGSPVARGRRV